MSKRLQAVIVTLSGALLLMLVMVALVYIWLARRYNFDIDRSPNVLAFLRQPEQHQEWVVPAGAQCGEAPFRMPTRGFIGFLWGDSFRIGHLHTGLDIFAGTDVGVTPVYAAYPGYLTRQADWLSTVIIRIPDDPLQPGRQIWTYYTHMADPDGNPLIAPEFPMGTQEVYVEAGQLLGYQGNYSGTPGSPTGIHLHFSIVLDDGQGHILNELEMANTLDPSPYLGMALDAETNRGEIPLCPP